VSLSFWYCDGLWRTMALAFDILIV
jgi:hypothetical protein